MVRDQARRGPVLLLERERELEQVDELLATAAAGEGQALVIEGRAGIGKTELLVEVQARARRAGIRVCAARATELESEFAFGVVRQLLEPVVRARGQEVLQGAAALAAPVLGQAGDGGGAGEFGVLHGLYWLAADLSAEAPLLLAVDDAHWADVPSLRWLAYLLNRLEGLPVLVALTARPARSGDTGEALAALRADPAVVVVRPEPLREESVTILLAESLGAQPDPTFAFACHRRATRWPSGA